MSANVRTFFSQSATNTVQALADLLLVDSHSQCNVVVRVDPSRFAPPMFPYWLFPCCVFPIRLLPFFAPNCQVLCPPCSNSTLTQCWPLPLHPQSSESSLFETSRPSSPNPVFKPSFSHPLHQPCFPIFIQTHSAANFCGKLSLIRPLGRAL